MDDVTLGHRPRLARGYHALMTEEHPREFGRDGVSGLVDRARAIRARLLPRRTAPRDERRPPAEPGKNTAASMTYTVRRALHDVNGMSSAVRIRSSIGWSS